LHLGSDKLSPLATDEVLNIDDPPHHIIHAHRKELGEYIDQL